MNRLNILIIVFSSTFLGCNQNRYSDMTTESCNCFESNLVKLESGIDDDINLVYEKCLTKYIQRIHKNEEDKQKNGTSNIDHLFQLSIEFTISLKSNCDIFNKYSEKLIHTNKKRNIKSGQVPKFKQIAIGKIKSIKRYDTANIEFNLLTLEGKSLTFFHKNIDDRHIGKVFEVEYEEKKINDEVILWCKELNPK